ncbi:MAG: TIGR02680 family protein [Pseudomonadota bacterium]
MTIVLPQPSRARWQPLRLGLVDIFHYDSEEFHFHDGHLLLRGNNGTGKSKVLSLTLPFLFDAQIKPSRIEPDGDPGKKMAWNLLMGRLDRRTGYVWAEFGRLDEGGRPRFVTLGCGLAAVAARPSVDAWYFVADDLRIGEALWLTSPQRVVLTRERLQDALGEHGQVFPNAESYRRAVDERLFRLGAARYAALMDTLIQLRQPQLSRRPDEASLSEALTEALPPLPRELLDDVADSMNQLEEYRHELDDLAALARAVGQFNRRYRHYAAIATRREAARLRAAQTEFDKASQAFNAAREALATAEAGAEECARRKAQADEALARARAAQAALQQDPALSDARRLDEARQTAERARAEATRAEERLASAHEKLRREKEADLRREQAAREAGAKLDAARSETAREAETCGLADELAQAELADAEGLAALDAAAWKDVREGLTELAARRREHLALIGKRLREADEARTRHDRERERRDAAADRLDEAGRRRGEADTAVERAGVALVEAWQAHFDRVRLLRPEHPEDALNRLAAWVLDPAGENPARAALLAAQSEAFERFARRGSALKQRRAELAEESEALAAERRRLEQGEDAAPPALPCRDATARTGRPGAPLWQLLEFRAHVDAGAAAGLEAALEASGLLDAWLMPDGRLLAADGASPWQDAFLLARTPRAASAADWLRPAEEAAVPAPVVAAVLESIACGMDDCPEAEAWIAPDGRFRLGPLAGAWTKPAARYIGHAARAAARRRRLAEIAERLAQIERALAIVAQESGKLEEQRKTAQDEWNTAPSDDALYAAHAEARAAARDFAAAQAALTEADVRLGAAERVWQESRERLAQDARDLRLPAERDALEAIDAALHRFGTALQHWLLAAQEVRHAWPERAVQATRTAEAEAEEARAREDAAASRLRAEEAQAAWQALFDTVGMKVEAILQRVEEARKHVEAGETAQKQAAADLLAATGEHARAEQKHSDCLETLEERRARREAAVAALQGFVASGLMAVALPDIESPDPAAPWTIDPALALARRAEQALATVKSGDEEWNRIQKQISEDYNELLRGLGALGHRAHADTSDHGLTVSVIWRNRPERPDRLEAILAEEIAQRSEMLTARERELLENHLQAEVASVIQRMLRAADAHVADINAELEKRPTSTGVRFRLIWEPRPEGEEGAPIGFAAARKRLLATSADAWSAEDRRVVGDMLQGRIALERSRAEAAGGSLLDQLSRALDYRRWHRFRVERWQGGKWGRLSGPASSGERALGLTVPLFAAVASHYTQGDYRDAPRLVLLDEAFAGIDREARAHCMALIREFDLDFVMTSESEWGCYAELPGVSICHLLRREDIDAVHVSRWLWDGRERRAVPDPERRFPEEAGHG